MEFLEIKDFRDLSIFLNLEPRNLGYMLMKLSRDSLYTNFDIPKKLGGSRKISAPNIQLRHIQHKLRLEFEEHYKPTAYAHGFIKNRSILTNAQKHVKKNWVVNIDLQDFFTTVTAKRVYGLMRAKPFFFDASVASYITNLVTYKGFVPQGATTSPIITNMICYRLDKSLAKYCIRHNITYTRYADDITFSADDRASLVNVYDEYSNEVSDAINNIIENNGFSINLDKVRCNLLFKHQEITGIKTNVYPNISNFHKYKIRAMLHAWEKYGFDLAVTDYMKKNSLEGDIELYKKTFTDQLIGLIAYAHMILGVNHAFYNKIAHQFNLLSKRNHFFVKYKLPDLYDYAVYSLIKYDSVGIPMSQSTAFYCNNYFLTCLHNIYPSEGFNFLKDLGNENAIKAYLITHLKHVAVISKIIGDEKQIFLDDVIIKTVLIERDLLVLELPNFYSPYSLKSINEMPDRRRKYTTLLINHECYDVDVVSSKLSSKKAIGDYYGYSLDTTIKLGMSGSPVVIENTNIVVGYIVYGVDEKRTDERAYQNAMYDFTNTII